MSDPQNLIDGAWKARREARHGDAERDLVEAERCYSEALSLYRAASAPPPLDFANAIRPAALLMEAVGDVETAQQLWSEARRFYETAGVRAGVEECERRLSRRDE